MTLATRILLILSAITMVSLTASASDAKRIMVIYGPGGHESAAKAIAADIQQTDPRADVFLYDFSKDLSGFWSWYHRKGYAFVIRKMPWLNEKLFEIGALQAKRFATTGARPAMLIDKQNPEVLLQKIDEYQPTAIITTHFNATETLGWLREHNKMRPIPTAWMDTDLMAETFFFQLSSSVDMTFSPHEQLTKERVERGVPQDRVMSTGISVNPLLKRQYTAAEITEIRDRLGLDGSRPSIALMGGSFGAFSYGAVIDSIVASSAEPVQIVAICGKNAAQKESLEALRSGNTRLPSGKSLPSNVKLVITGSLTQPELVEYLAASDTIVSKPGGMATFELPYRLKPTIYVDRLGANERINGRFIEDVLGTGLVTEQESEVGPLLTKFRENPSLVEDMIAAEKRFISGHRPEKVVEWALNPPPVHQPMAHTVPISQDADRVHLSGFGEVGEEIGAVIAGRGHLTRKRLDQKPTRDHLPALR